MTMTSSSVSFYVVLFLLSSLVTGHSLISSLVLRYWTEIREVDIPPPEFCLISGDWGELGIRNLARLSLIKCYWMLQIANVTIFTVSELLRGKQQGGGRGCVITPKIKVIIHLEKLILNPNAISCFPSIFHFI